MLSINILGGDSWQQKCDLFSEPQGHRRGTYVPVSEHGRRVERLVSYAFLVIDFFSDRCIGTFFQDDMRFSHTYTYQS